jgi:phosphatidylserine/phosphatidylglycerophosphate/cardiolipin synthase-like enzyme
MRTNQIFIALLPFVLSCSHITQTAQYQTPDLHRRPAAQSPLLAEDTDVVSTSFDLQTRGLDGSSPEDLVGVYSNAKTAPVARLLDLAQTSIEIEIYEMDDPAVRASLRKALNRKPKPVQIRVIKDPNPVGQICDPFASESTPLPDRGGKAAPASQVADCVDQRRLVSEIRASHNGQFVPFAKSELCGQDSSAKPSCFEHGKMILIDDRYALVSTGNFNSSNLCDLDANPGTCNRDYSYITRDPEVVNGLKQIYDMDLKAQRYDLKSILSRGNLPEKITASPYSLDPLVRFLSSAQTSIQIQNQYIRRDSGLVDVLIAKSLKGVQVEIQLADLCNYNSVPDSQAEPDKEMFQKMQAAGIVIRMFDKKHLVQGKQGYLHAKVIVIDGTQAWLGSVNGSDESLNKNREFGIFFNQPQRVAALSRYMKADFDHPESQTWQSSLSCIKVGYMSPDSKVSFDPAQQNEPTATAPKRVRKSRKKNSADLFE